MFDFKNMNKEQKEAIIHTEGPLLITAGPGTGKTFTLVNRITYLIQEKGVSPENIFVATFTEKAAKELITRISNELMEKNILVNINEMYIGTFHSLCLKMVKENLEYTSLRKNIRVMDSFEQSYFIYRNLYKFRSIENYEKVISGSVWNESTRIAEIVNKIREELIDYKLLINSSDIEISTVGKIIETYVQLCESVNVLDFTSIQTECFQMLVEQETVLNSYKEKIKYIMIDEYQDTNYIQEQLVFLLGSESQNICVVGDDDQGLYRFRGATIRNIFEFPNKFEKCKIINLNKNYRSDKKIINFFNNWMNSTEGRDFSFDWNGFRYNKSIESGLNNHSSEQTVFKISGESEDLWQESIYRFITSLMGKKVIEDYNQIAFLSSSVKNKRIQSLIKYLESNGISVYSPRSNLYFERPEIQLIIGIYLLIFPNYISETLEDIKLSWFPKHIYIYYESCFALAKSWLSDLDEISRRIVIGLGKNHINLVKNKENLDYGLTGLFYKIMQFEPFKTILEKDLDNGVKDQRDIRNLALFSELLSKYEFENNITVLTYKNIDRAINNFFSNYLRFLIDGGLDEYEDDTEYAPSGCVSFLTIHQSKGMEFPIVIVSSLWDRPINRTDKLLDKILELYSNKEDLEAKEYIKFFDFWRLYYTAFSRAQNMLILSTAIKGGSWSSPSKYFENQYRELVEYSPDKIDLNKINVDVVKDVNIKQTYSFTSDISVYNTCSLQYKFFNDLEFTPVRVGSTVFGTLIHQTIEDIHKEVLLGNLDKVIESNIEEWFNTNYSSIVDSQHVYLGKPQLDSALKQVYRYVYHEKENWRNLKEAEVDVSLVKDNYILKGQIDLVSGEGNTVDILDFKSSKKPDLINDREEIEHYKKQLQVYAHLLEEKKGLNVNKMHLYYTGAENENPRISFSKDKESINKTIRDFDMIVENIENKRYRTRSNDYETCKNCDMRHFCNK